jgi:hypothetical protein
MHRIAQPPQLPWSGPAHHGKGWQGSLLPLFSPWLIISCQCLQLNTDCLFGAEVWRRHDLQEPCQQGAQFAASSEHCKLFTIGSLLQGWQRDFSRPYVEYVLVH